MCKDKELPGSYYHFPQRIDILVQIHVMMQKGRATGLLLAILLWCTHAMAQPTQVQMKKLQGYFFSGSEAMLKKGVNCFVVQQKKDFEKFFGKNRADTPSFSKEWMLILVMPATKKDIQLEFERISMKAGDFIEVYCDFGKLKGKGLPYEANPIAVCVIPRYDSIHTVRFYEERRKGLEPVETVTLKNVR